MKKSTTLAIGVTGGIGSGKTEVCKIFEKLGAQIYYADPVARLIIDANETMKKRIMREFGDDIYTKGGTLDRKRMAKLIFHDESLKEKLDAIVHPAVLDFLESEIKKAKTSNVTPLVVVEAALIYESGAERMFDYIVAVDAEEGVRIDRVMKRDGVSKTEVTDRMKSQLRAEKKNSKADFIVRNDGDLKLLGSNCEFLYHLLVGISRRSHFSES